MTLINDWNSVFYRKAIIYKRRVEQEIAAAKNRYKESWVSGSRADSFNSSSQQTAKLGQSEDGWRPKQQDMAAIDA